MIRRIRPANQIAGALAVVLALPPCLTACSSTSTSVIDSHVDESFRGRTLSHVLVIGLAEQDENEVRFETSFGQQLRDRGIASTARNEVMGLQTEVTRDSVVAAIEGTAIESVLVARLISRQEVDVSTAVRTEFGGSFEIYLERTANPLQQPVEAPVFFIETVLFDRTSEQRMWSVETSTFDPRSIQEILDGLTTAILDDLQAQGFI